MRSPGGSASGLPHGCFLLVAGVGPPWRRGRPRRGQEARAARWKWIPRV